MLPTLHCTLLTRSSDRDDALYHAARFFREEAELSGYPIAQRAVAASPKGYTPSQVNCPKERPEIRAGSDISPQEKEWLLKRRNETIDPIKSLLKRLAIPDFDSDKYLANVKNDSTALPNIGLAISGGGYRAMLTGAGAVSAWDSRSPGSQDNGNLGGLLQSATYMSGLSGGGWLVGSLYTNNFTSVTDSISYSGIWSLQDSILKGPDTISLLRYYTDIVEEVEGKDRAEGNDGHNLGFDTSITDYWGRMLSYQLVNASDGGPGYTFSSIAHDDDFSSGKAPMPFLVANGRAPGEKRIWGNSTVYEFTPWELGSRDTALSGYAPLKYVGSRFKHGKLPDNESCVVGFDNAGFVMGTSSSLFNQFVLYLKDKDSQYVPSDVPDFAIDAISHILNALGDAENDIADWSPNPFKGFNAGASNASSLDTLTLVDGGEDLQNIPYYPHLHPQREVDVVFSVDSSADTHSNWPDGISPISTWERSKLPIANGTAPFPPVPDKDSFINLGLNSKPTFFGCDASNFSDPSSVPPLIVYLPNYPYVYAANVSTFQLSTSEDERDAIIENGWAVATMYNSTRESDWSVCVACAVLARSFHRTNTSVPDACEKCFDKYCWDGSINSTKVEDYFPNFYTTPIKVEESVAASLRTSAFTASIALMVWMLV